MVPSILTRYVFPGAVSSRHVLLPRVETRIRHFLAGLGIDGFATANVPASSVPAWARICFGPRAVCKCGSRTGFAAISAVSWVENLSLNESAEKRVRPTGPNIDHTTFAFYAPSRSDSSLSCIGGRRVVLTWDGQMHVRNQCVWQHTPFFLRIRRNESWPSTHAPASSRVS